MMRLTLVCREPSPWVDKHRGDWATCGATETFQGQTLTDVTDVAVRADWQVDAATVGEASRDDRCPDHRDRHRPSRVTGLEWLGRDTMRP